MFGHKSDVTMCVTTSLFVVEQYYHNVKKTEKLSINSKRKD